MEPPLKSRFPWIIPDALQAPRFGRSTFPPVTRNAHCRGHYVAATFLIRCSGIASGALELEELPQLNCA